MTPDELVTCNDLERMKESILKAMEAMLHPAEPYLSFEQARGDCSTYGTDDASREAGGSNALGGVFLFVVIVHHLIISLIWCVKGLSGTSRVGILYVHRTEGLALLVGVRYAMAHDNSPAIVF